MKDHLEKQMVRIFISSKDMANASHYFNAAERAAKEASTEEDWYVVSGLVAAGIVAYGRPFSGNEAHETAIPTPPFSMSTLTAAEQVLHSRLLDLRNRAIAHSDADMNPTSVREHMDNGFLIMNRIYNPITDHSNSGAYAVLAKKVKCIFEGKMFELSRKVNGLES